MAKNLLAVAIGGAIGTALRFGLVLPVGFSTIIINLVGSFVLGLLVSGVWTKPSTPEWVKAGIGPGLLGSFTTLSGLLLIGFTSEDMTSGVFLIFLGLVTSLLAALIGIFAGTKMAGRNS